MGNSFDHLVGAGEERRRHVEAKGFGGFHVDAQYELGRKLDQQIGRLGDFQNLIDKVSRPPVAWQRDHKLVPEFDGAGPARKPTLSEYWRPILI
jgi:hypothetical protein